MSKKLVLAGGGHAHMMILAELANIIADGHQVTVIQPSDHHYYSGMGPGMLSTYYSADDIRFNTRFVVERQGGLFVRDKVTRIEADSQTVVTENGTSIAYDVLSCNLGSFVPFENIEGGRERIFTAKPIERLLEAQRKIIELADTGRISICVVGGGPAAVEIAGNCHHLAAARGSKDIDIHLLAGKKMMAGYSDAIGRIIRKTFDSRGVAIDESGYATTIVDGSVILDNDKSFSADIIFVATGVKPSRVFAESGLATGADGGLLVDRFLRCPDHHNIFGGGDCISYSPSPLDKVGVYAVRQNPVLLHNVKAALNGTELQQFDPGGNYLLIFNLGEKYGALQKGPFVWGGKSSFFIKDYIDRKFMRRFQTLEE